MLKALDHMPEPRMAAAVASGFALAAIASNALGHPTIASILAVFGAMATSERLIRVKNNSDRSGIRYAAFGLLILLWVLTLLATAYFRLSPAASS